jgi:hypothetical protein
LADNARDNVLRDAGFLLEKPTTMILARETHAGRDGISSRVLSHSCFSAADSRAARKAVNAASSREAEFAEV